MSGICVAEKSDAKPSYTSYLHGLRVIGGSKRHDFLPSLLRLYVAHLMARFAQSGVKADTKGVFQHAVLAGHLGNLPPKDLTAPRTWFTSCVRVLTSAWRERIKAIWAWESSPRCLSGYKSFGSRRARRARFSASISSVLRLLA